MLSAAIGWLMLLFLLSVMLCLSLRLSDGISMESESDESDLESPIHELRNTNPLPPSGKCGVRHSTRATSIFIFDFQFIRLSIIEDHLCRQMTATITLLLIPFFHCIS